jgi:hypothetical protein
MEKAGIWLSKRDFAVGKAILETLGQKPKDLANVDRMVI